MEQDTFKTKVINSENPYEHWNDISDLYGKTVLDLGCGWLWQPHECTPEYFIKRGASKIVGVDVTQPELDTLSKLYPNDTFLCLNITKAEQLQELISQYSPDVIKMDIEGNELVLNELQDLGTATEIAIEYHSQECKIVVLNKLKEFGFKIFAINKFGYHCLDDNIMGVIHARK
jgi:hypothetical protein